MLELSKKVVVADPCYTLNTWCLGVVENVKEGKYEEVVSYADGRVAEIEVVHYDYMKDFLENRLLSYELHSTNIGVDSGQCGIYDYVFFEQYDNNKGEYDELETFYGKACNITLSEQQAGVHDNKGFVSNSGYGDGCYNCYIAENNQGEVIAIKVVFIDLEEYEEE